MVVARKTPFTTYGPRKNVLLVNNDGVLTDMTAELAPQFLIADNSRDVMSGDFNGDGWLDLVVANATYFQPKGEQPRLYINLGEDASGTWLGFVEESFRLPFLVSPTGNEPNFSAVAVGDVIGNGSRRGRGSRSQYVANFCTRGCYKSASPPTLACRTNSRLGRSRDHAR